jgi:hypothetical protein
MNLRRVAADSAGALRVRALEGSTPSPASNFRLLGSRGGGVTAATVLTVKKGKSHGWF